MISFATNHLYSFLFFPPDIFFVQQNNIFSIKKIKVTKFMTKLKKWSFVFFRKQYNFYFIFFFEN